MELFSTLTMDVLHHQIQNRQILDKIEQTLGQPMAVLNPTKVKQ
jgi:hypothetical protein